MKKEMVLYFHGLINVRKNKFSGKNKKLLIIQLAPLGDACTLIPTCQNLEKLGYKLDYICQRGLLPLWQKFFPDSEIVEIPETDWSVKSIQKFLQPVIKNEYEAVFVTSMKPYAAFLASFIKTSSRLGMVETSKFYKGSKLLFNSVTNVGKQEHVTDRFKNLFRLHINSFSNKKQVSTDLRFGDYVLLHPGGKWNPRRWPRERYFETGQALVRQGLEVHVVIHSSETDLLEYFSNVVDNKNFKISQTETILDLIAEVENCALFIGNDSGPAHLANIYGKESIILWGPGNYERIHPKGENNLVLIKDVKCRPCKQYIHPERCQRGENVCLLRTEVSEVLDNAFLKLRSVTPGRNR